jgi:hypothetical protein
MSAENQGSLNIDSMIFHIFNSECNGRNSADFHAMYDSIALLIETDKNSIASSYILKNLTAL